MAAATYSPARQNSNDNTYPFQPSKYDSHSNNTTVAPSTFDPKVVEEARLAGRTPSPTPSEQKELESGAINWKSMKNWRFWIRREWLWYYVIFVVILTITALVSIYHTQIVNWLTPVTKWLFNLKFGWLVPIGILFVISFPPLFGHEIVAILCGLVWGLWVGFGIVCAGTFIGEVGNFYAFKYCCRSRGEKLERTKLSYACLARVVRDGGFKIALIARLSAIPGHFTTAIFSTCGMGIIVFSIAAILSLPKQFITVYLGVILEQSNQGVTDNKSRIISDVVLVITFLITILAMWYIIHMMNKAKPQVIYDRRKARQGKLERAGHPLYASGTESSSTVGFNPSGSDSDIPLTAAGQSRYQQWDKHGNAIGYTPDPNLYAPSPRRAAPAGFKEDATHARQSTVEVGWDMGAVQNIREDPYNAASPHTSTPSSPRAGARSPPTHAQPEPRHRNPYPNPYLNESTEYTPTPTQASFGNNWNEPSAPHAQAYSTPFDGPTDAYVRRGHEQEPTDSTFRTAFTSSPVHADDMHDHPTAPTAHRAFSPPPPSYATNLR